MKILLAFFFLFFSISLVGCQPTGTSGYSKQITPQCRAAKSNFQMCYGNCLMVTPGGLITAMGICGNKCMNYSVQVSYACN